MNSMKMLLEELLPFYFLLMVGVIMFTSHVPTKFELYIVYAFSFGVAIFNNRLYKKNEKVHSWGVEVYELLEIMENENEELRYEVSELNRELELIYFGSSSNGTGIADDSDVRKISKKHL